MAGTAWDKYWNSLSSASQLGTLLGELSSTGQYWTGEGWFADEVFMVLSIIDAGVLCISEHTEDIYA